MLDTNVIACDVHCVLKRRETEPTSDTRYLHLIKSDSDGERRIDNDILLLQTPINWSPELPGNIPQFV